MCIDLIKNYKKYRDCQPMDCQSCLLTRWFDEEICCYQARQCCQCCEEWGCGWLENRDKPFKLFWMHILDKIKGRKPFADSV